MEINPLLDDAQLIRLAAELFVAGSDEQAREVLRMLSNEPKRKSLSYRKAAPSATSPGHRSRVSPKAAEKFAILASSGWRCNFCGQRLVMHHLMELLSLRAPDIVSFSPEHKFKESFTHPAFVRCQHAVDHLESGALSGRWLDPDNLVAACAACNEFKNDGLAPPFMPRVADDWDGGASVFLALAEGQPKRFSKVVSDLRLGLRKAKGT